MTHRLSNYRTHDKDDDHRTTTYMGVIKLDNNPHRRIDIKVWPREQYPYALLHFTGNGHFNRSMRLYAKQLGYTLSDHGLCAANRNPHTKERVSQAISVPAETEEDIFKALNLKYMPPEFRTAGVDEITAEDTSQETGDVNVPRTKDGNV